MKSNNHRKMNLIDTCSLNMGQSPVSSSYNQNQDGLPFYQGNADFGNINPIPKYYCNKPTKIAHKNDILLSVRAPIGALNIADSTCCIGRGLTALTPKENTNFKYLYYVLKSKYSDLLSKGTGSTFKAINKESLSTILIPLPDLNIQKKIANTLDKVNNLIDLRKQQLEKLDLLIKSKFVDMFGDPLTNPKNFNIRKIKDYAMVISGSTPNTNNPIFWDGTLKWITPAEMENNSFIIYDTQRKITPLGAKSCSLNILPKGTILLSSRAPIGKLAIAGTEMYCNQGFKNLILDTKVANSIFIYYLLKNKKQNIIDLGRGATFKEISKPIVENIKTYLPPIQLQNKFSEFVEEIEKQKLLVNKSLKKLELLYKSLMQKYFENTNG